MSSVGRGEAWVGRGGWVRPGGLRTRGGGGVGWWAGEAVGIREGGGRWCGVDFVSRAGCELNLFVIVLWSFAICLFSIAILQRLCFLSDNGLSQ